MCQKTSCPEKKEKKTFRERDGTDTISKTTHKLARSYRRIDRRDPTVVGGCERADNCCNSSVSESP